MMRCDTFTISPYTTDSLDRYRPVRALYVRPIVTTCEYKLLLSGSGIDLCPTYVEQSSIRSKDNHKACFIQTTSKNSSVVSRFGL